MIKGVLKLLDEGHNAGAKTALELLLRTGLHPNDRKRLQAAWDELKHGSARDAETLLGELKDTWEAMARAIKRLPLPQGIVTVTTGTRFKTTGYDEAWRGKLARELNTLMELADWLRTDHGPISEHEDEQNVKGVEALLSVVRRVAEFEDIRTRKGERVV